MASNNPTVVLKDVLYEFTLAKAVPDAELLDDFIRLPGSNVMTRYNNFSFEEQLRNKRHP